MGRLKEHYMDVVGWQSYPGGTGSCWSAMQLTPHSSSGISRWKLVRWLGEPCGSMREASDSARVWSRRLCLNFNSAAVIGGSADLTHP